MAALPPLPCMGEELVATSSGLDRDTKERVKAAINAAGGVYEAELRPGRCNLVVAADAGTQSAKVQAARKGRIRIVDPVTLFNQLQTEQGQEAQERPQAEPPSCNLLDEQHRNNAPWLVHYSQLDRLGATEAPDCGLRDSTNTMVGLNTAAVISSSMKPQLPWRTATAAKQTNQLPWAAQHPPDVCTAPSSAASRELATAAHVKDTARVKDAAARVRDPAGVTPTPATAGAASSFGSPIVCEAQQLPALPSPPGGECSGSGSRLADRSPAAALHRTVGCSTTSTASTMTDALPLFSGMCAILDPQLAPEAAAAAREQLQAGGATVLAGGGHHMGLGSGATAVVAEPARAAAWLHLGLDVLTPAWVARSSASGSQHKACRWSADAMKQVAGQLAGILAPPPPAASMAVSSAGAVPQEAETGCWSDAAERQQLLQRLSAMGPNPSSAPLALLTHVSWNVLDAPSHRTVCFNEGDERGALDQSQQQQQPAFLPATQLDMDLLLQPSQGVATPARWAAGAGCDAEQLEEVVFRGSRLVILLPLDERGEAGAEAVTFSAPPGGLTTLALLGLVHGHYQRVLSLHDMAGVMAAAPALVAGLKDAFLAGQPRLRRADLLGGRVAFEGLQRLTRDAAVAVYELLLAK